MPPPPAERRLRAAAARRRAATGRSAAGTRRPGWARTAAASAPARPPQSSSRSSPGSAAAPSLAYSRTVAPATASHGRTPERQRCGGGPARRRRPRQTTAIGVPGDLLLERPRGALGDHRAVVDDHDPVTQHVGLIEVVRGQEDRGAPLPEAADVLPEIRPVLRVQPGARLVQEQHLGLVHDAERDVEAAALAARVGGHPAVGEPGQVQQGQHLLRPPGDLGPAAPYSRPCSIRFSRPVASSSAPPSWLT